MEMMARLIKRTPMAQFVAKKIEETTDDAITYVRRHTLRRMGRDLVRRVNRRPMQSMMAMTAVGFLVGMLVKRR